jgi:hypothetical protein
MIVEFLADNIRYLKTSTPVSDGTMGLSIQNWDSGAMAATPAGELWYSRGQQRYYHMCPLSGSAVWMPHDYVHTAVTQTISVDAMQAISQSVLTAAAANGLSPLVSTKLSKMKGERDTYQAMASTALASASEDASPAVVRYNFVLDQHYLTACFFYSG